MIINKNSLHYKFVEKLYSIWNNERIPSNLCEYFWKTSLMVTLSIFLVLVSIGIIFSMLSPLITLMGYEINHQILAFGAIVDITILGTIICISLTNIKLVKTMYKSIKEKYCPIIEFKDGE